MRWLMLQTKNQFSIYLFEAKYPSQTQRELFHGPDEVCCSERKWIDRQTCLGGQGIYHQRDDHKGVKTYKLIIISVS